MTEQTPAEIRQHLADQLEFLSSSARAFDDGRVAEATRLAQMMRVLLHDGINIKTGAITSPSLLRQIGWIDDTTFLDSGGEPHPGTMLSSCTLVYSKLGPGSTAEFYPRLDGFPTQHAIPDHLRALMSTHEGRELLVAGVYRPFPVWWNMPVIRDMAGDVFSRGDLVRFRANQDGGAHVDPKLRPKYSRISRENSMRRFRGTGDELVPMASPVTPAIRQIAYEVAVSMNLRLDRYRAESGRPPL